MSTQATAQATTQPGGDAATTAGAAGTHGPGPLTTSLPAGQVLEVLGTLSRKGKLPGFERVEGGFVCKAFGDPFDHVMRGGLKETGGTTRIDFQLTVAPKLPAITLLLTLLSIQPGMWLTDSMLVTYSSWYAANVRTWWWYLPLVILPTPFMVWRMWTRSKRSAQEHAAELHERLVVALNARPSADAKT